MRQTEPITLRICWSFESRHRGFSLGQLSDPRPEPRIIRRWRLFQERKVSISAEESGARSEHRLGPWCEAGVDEMTWV
jgi:hypothetical protein